MEDINECAGLERDVYMARVEHIERQGLQRHVWKEQHQSVFVRRVFQIEAGQRSDAVGVPLPSGPDLSTAAAVWTVLMPDHSELIAPRRVRRQERGVSATMRRKERVK